MSVEQQVILEMSGHIASAFCAVGMLFGLFSGFSLGALFVVLVNLLFKKWNERIVNKGISPKNKED